MPPRPPPPHHRHPTTYRRTPNKFLVVLEGSVGLASSRESSGSADGDMQHRRTSTIAPVLPLSLSLSLPLPLPLPPVLQAAGITTAEREAKNKNSDHKKEGQAQKLNVRKTTVAVLYYDTVSDTPIS